MKQHLTKRLLAGFLTGLMLFGSASAAGPATSDLTDASSGAASGVARNEGAVPAEVVDLKLPTGAGHIFDFYIDPHNNIADTGGMRYGQNLEIGSGSLFFKNSDSNGNVTGLSRNSDDLKIINTGMTPLDVELNLSFSKGGNSFRFSPTTNFMDENGVPIQGPAIYLALVSGLKAVPVADVVDR